MILTQEKTIEQIYYRDVGNEAEVFKLCYDQKLPLMIKGPTGCGKSQFVSAMSERLNRPLIKVSCNEDTTAADLVGRFLIKNRDTIWQDGPVVRAVREGAILYLDEVAEAREDVIVILHSLTDHRREIYIDRTNENLYAPDNFMCVASFNPGYQRGFKELKPSTRQRFVSLSLNYPAPEVEAEILQTLTGISALLAKKLVIFATGIRQQPQLGLRETISTRLLVYSSELIKAGMHPRQALLHGAVESLSDDLKIIQALKDMTALHF
ncbi:MAG: AAA family ATPase [Bdellovibrionales bacterium RIFCSPHIGHO2_01_FULL_40_29]|nr:MAG: AAA family ATPase [Bdellovibrionales bacterium RIFCSPHIGHO2_01_FULL_40_29]OFZ34286.1 MAG: AAA family ATPase [Bdellovibrionales bacterium RIFCSPHIGHO2_02_FULL_40_15]